VEKKKRRGLTVTRLPRCRPSLRVARVTHPGGPGISPHRLLRALSDGPHGTTGWRKGRRVQRTSPTMPNDFTSSSGSAAS
jgi:hypothetical protein